MQLDNIKLHRVRVRKLEFDSSFQCHYNSYKTISSKFKYSMALVELELHTQNNLQPSKINYRKVKSTNVYSNPHFS